MKMVLVENEKEKEEKLASSALIGAKSQWLIRSGKEGGNTKGVPILFVKEHSAD